MDILTIAPLLTVVMLATVQAGTLAGVEMPETIPVDGATLHLNGMGLRQATALRVKAYVGGLYLERRSSDPQTVIDSHQLKRVTMQFLRDIDAKRLGSGWAESLRKVGGKKLEPSIARFVSFIPDVKNGATMSFTWRPGVGLETALAGTTRGTIPGDDFARALFTVWFGPKPGDEKLKRGMLGL
jgi:chalcone isomerase-like protein